MPMCKRNTHTIFLCRFWFRSEIFRCFLAGCSFFVIHCCFQMQHVLFSYFLDLRSLARCFFTFFTSSPALLPTAYSSILEPFTIPVHGVSSVHYIEHIHTAVHHQLKQQQQQQQQELQQHQGITRRMNITHIKKYIHSRFWMYGRARARSFSLALVPSLSLSFLVRSRSLSVKRTKCGLNAYPIRDYSVLLRLCIHYTQITIRIKEVWGLMFETSAGFFCYFFCFSVEWTIRRHSRSLWLFFLVSLVCCDSNVYTYVEDEKNLAMDHEKCLFHLLFIFFLLRNAPTVCLPKTLVRWNFSILFPQPVWLVSPSRLTTTTTTSAAAAAFAAGYTGVIRASVYVCIKSVSLFVYRILSMAKQFTFFVGLR